MDNYALHFLILLCKKDKTTIGELELFMSGPLFMKFFQWTNTEKGQQSFKNINIYSDRNLIA